MSFWPKGPREYGIVDRNMKYNKLDDKGTVWGTDARAARSNLIVSSIIRRNHQKSNSSCICTQT